MSAPNVPAEPPFDSRFPPRVKLAPPNCVANVEPPANEKAAGVAKTPGPAAALCAYSAYSDAEDANETGAVP